MLNTDSAERGGGRGGHGNSENYQWDRKSFKEQEIDVTKLQGEGEVDRNSLKEQEIKVKEGEGEGGRNPEKT